MTTQPSGDVLMSSPGDDLWEPEEQFAQLHFFLVAQGHRDVLLFPQSIENKCFKLVGRCQKKTVNTRTVLFCKEKEVKPGIHT